MSKKRYSVKDMAKILNKTPSYIRAVISKEAKVTGQSEPYSPGGGHRKTYSQVEFDIIKDAFAKKGPVGRPKKQINGLRST